MNAPGGADAVIHLAALIPPLADRIPALAESVNIGGTANLLACLKVVNPAARLVFTSSISVYGDRVARPYITMADPLTPNPDDHYAHHKIRCEEMIRASGLSFTIFRLSYIVSVRKLGMDRIMFDIPLATSFEICDSADAALALVNAAGNPGAIPDRAFRVSGFHCGFMETGRSEALLHYQRSTLADYFARVREKTKGRRFFISLVRAIARQALFARSPYLNAGAR